MKEQIVMEAHLKIEETIERTECAVICILVLHPQAFCATLNKITAEQFLVPAYGFIYGSMLRLNEAGTPISLIALDNDLRATNPEIWLAMGGIQALSKWLTQAYALDALERYLDEVRRHFMLRSLQALFATMQGKAALFEADYQGLIAEAEADLLEIRALAATGSEFHSVGTLATEVLEIHRRKAETGIDTMCIPTGMEELDYVVGGLYRGELTVLAARPSDGKTSLAMHIAFDTAQRGFQTCFFALEMTRVQTMNRYFAGGADVNPDNLRITGATSRDLEKMTAYAARIQSLPLYFCHDATVSVAQIRAQVLLKSKQGRCDLVVVDYLHLIPKEGGARNSTPDQMLGRIVTALKRLAIEVNCPVLLLSQMNRNSENRVEKAHLPEMHDLRDSGVIEQVADCVCFIYRPTRHGIKCDPETHESYHNVGLLYVKKCRNGSIGEARFRHNASFTVIDNYKKKL